MSCDFSGRQVKLGQIEAVADVITDMGVEEQGHAFGPKVSVPVFTRPHGVDLGVSVQIPHPLDVHNNQVVSRSLKGEVTESLEGKNEFKSKFGTCTVILVNVQPNHISN